MIICGEMDDKYDMYIENTYSPFSGWFSNQLNLSDFGFEKLVLEKIKEI